MISFRFRRGGQMGIGGGDAIEGEGGRKLEGIGGGRTNSIVNNPLDGYENP